MDDGFTVRPLRTVEELRACVDLQRATWGEDFSEVVPPTLLKVVQKVGGVAAGAFDADDRLAGFVFGISGIRDGRPVHWSDMLAVRHDLRNRRLGERLKRFQRELLLHLGIETIYWTFDPLESKNAHLNFARLGVTAEEYVRDLYAESNSLLHQGIGTDRLIAEWRIGESRVERRLAGVERAPTAGEVAALPLCNDTKSGPGGLESEPPALDLSAERIRVAIPSEIQALKERSPALAADWREKTRAVFEAYLPRGYRVVEVVREGERTCYVLERFGREALAR